MIQNNEHGCAPIKLHLWTLIFDFIHISQITRKSSPRPQPRPFKDVKTTISSQQTKMGWGGDWPKAGVCRRLVHLAEEGGDRLEKQQRGGLRSRQVADGEGRGQAPGGVQAGCQAGYAPTGPGGLSPPQTYSGACAQGGSCPRGSASRARGSDWDLAEPAEFARRRVSARPSFGAPLGPQLLKGSPR